MEQDSDRSVKGKEWKEQVNDFSMVGENENESRSRADYGYNIRLDPEWVRFPQERRVEGAIPRRTHRRANIYL